MTINGYAGVAGIPWIPFAWIEAMDHECLFIATGDNVGAFRRQQLPREWTEQFRSPVGNLVIAQEIDIEGSPGDTPLSRVARLQWPL